MVRQRSTFPCDGDGVKEGLHRRLAEAPSPLMSSLLVEAFDPLVEVGLQLGDGTVDLLAEGHAVEFVEHRLVETLDDTSACRPTMLRIA